MQFYFHQLYKQLCGMLWCSFWLSCCVDWYVGVSVSEKHAVSIVRAEDGGSMLLWNVGIYQPVHMAA
jgi:hypothetical protein